MTVAQKEMANRLRKLPGPLLIEDDAFWFKGTCRS